jgi:thiol-disulfide isomerase/thioredoxin
VNNGSGAGVLAAIAALLLAGCGDRAAARLHHVYDLEGRLSDPFVGADGKPLVLLFVRSDCPISNRYAPDVQRLHRRFREQVAFLLVYVDPDESRDTIQRHLGEYGYSLEALRDPRHELVRLTGVRVTPEAALFAPGGHLLYRGRIDDRYSDFGQRRLEPSSRDLEEALERVAQGKLGRTVTTEAVGCFISDLQ